MTPGRRQCHRQEEARAHGRADEKSLEREIEGELIIVPLVAGIGDADDELFTLNETGKAI